MVTSNCSSNLACRDGKCVDPCLYYEPNLCSQGFNPNTICKISHNDNSDYEYLDTGYDPPEYDDYDYDVECICKPGYVLHPFGIEYGCIRGMFLTYKPGHLRMPLKSDRLTKFEPL